MWSYNTYENKWELDNENLKIDNFNYYKQQLGSYRFYSKCLSGSTYIPINDTSNIYDVISDYIPRNWYISNTYSQYSSSFTPGQYAEPTNDDYYKKYIEEYGLTLKNLFNPERLIKDSINNFIYVDVATVENLYDLNDSVANRKIDGIRLKEGSRVLVKDQQTNISLPNTINPDDYFKGEYQIVEVIGGTTEYLYYNEDNGIYVYRNNTLIRENDLDNYENCVRFSVFVKMGNENSGQQFHLSRLNNNYFPTTLEDDPILFKSKKNWMIRNQVDYNNIFDINYYDVIKHGEQKYLYEGITYSIPSRIISVGEFGTIINNQSGFSNIIRNKYKVNLRSIDQTEKYYWIVADKGIILKIRKHDFNIERIKADCYCPQKIVKTNLKSISFYDNYNGVIVGEINTILITKDGGLNWTKINIESFNPYYYNKAIFKDLNNFYVAGNNGVFIHFKNNSDGWKAYKRRISKFISDEDEFILFDNINDMILHKIYDWDPLYNYITLLTNPEKELLFIVTDNNNIIIHDINKSISTNTEFMYLEFKDKNYTDIKRIEKKSDENKFYFTGFDQETQQQGIFSFELSNFESIGIGNSYSNRLSSDVNPVFESSYYPNNIFDYEGLDLFIAGNNSMLFSSSYSSTFSFSELDESFYSKLKSKLLFLDYDIASKLNFFTDDGEYRLPNSLQINLNESLGSYIEFEPLSFYSQYSGLTISETNWWQYESDSISTFEYYSTYGTVSDVTKVYPSSKFEWSNIQNTILTDNITIDVDDIINLAPNITNKESSRFYGVGLTAISEPLNYYDVYLYDYLMVIRYLPSEFDVSVGNMVRIEVDNFISVNFLVNKIENINSNYYAYLFNDFNDSIIKSIKNSNSIKLTNLNKFNTLLDLESNFNLHPISKGYNITSSTGSITINPLFNNQTSYYNLGTNVLTASGAYKMEYDISFTKFGYKPTYNLLDYLEYLNDSDINPLFYANKEYLSMPVYSNIPLSGSMSNITESVYIKDNKLIFGNKLQFEWRSIFINTFVDIELKEYAFSSSTTPLEKIETKRLLVIDKYYDSNNDVYVIEFHKKIYYSPSSFIIIKSRRTLHEISDDLQYLNNIQRAPSYKEYEASNWYVSYNTFEKYLNFKINTDSYAKILLSDYDTVRSISGLIYTDYKGDISLNITSLDSEKTVEFIDTENNNGKLRIICSDKHNLSTGDGIVLYFNGGELSSEFINNKYFGYHIVTYENEYRLTIDVDYGEDISINDTGYFTYIIRDPFLNYQPIDIIDIGVDKRSKISIELSPDNTDLSGDIYSLVDVDYKKYRFRLVDGLDVESLSRDYKWIYEAEISDAIIGRDSNGLIWYSGTWECGRWFGGTWISGAWLSGDWYEGTWKSKLIKDNYISVEVNNRFSDKNKSIWYSGRWFGGNWENGTWISGRWYGGNWLSGEWRDGIWNDGNWVFGDFTGGIWVLGTFQSGIFSSLNAPSYWIDGNFKSGDFENGLWFNGNFGSSLRESRFGTKSNNSRPSIWKSGNFINGSFHSRLNVDDDGKYDVSDIHKYSVWHSGNWYNGNFYGGVVYNIDFKSGTWNGGILEDVEIVGMYSTASGNYFLIKGNNEFNIGYEITIIDNQLNGEYSEMGSNESPGVYTVVYSIEDIPNNLTKIYVDGEITKDLDPISNSGLRLVSRFRNCNWKSGIWTNGIYENGLMEGGIWYNGIFYATWS